MLCTKDRLCATSKRVISIKNSSLRSDLGAHRNERRFIINGSVHSREAAVKASLELPLNAPTISAALQPIHLPTRSCLAAVNMSSRPRDRHAHRADQCVAHRPDQCAERVAATATPPVCVCEEGRV
uniref:Uncharacterized protein n=1 Tax=Knipowitschia caucasica TaxID=637954 RepID=A0AAV2JKM1_KNICA